MSLRRRVLALTSLGALAVSLVAAPASAAGATRWVDDDGTRGPNGCDGGLGAKKTITAGIAAAQAGDTIKVCPGVYIEELELPKARLTLRSVVKGKAVVRDPATIEMAAGPALIMPPLVRILANDVTFSGFKVVMPPIDGCVTRDGIGANGVDGVRVIGNTLLGRSDDPTGLCGFERAILFQDARGTVSGNVVRDWVAAGIDASDGSNVSILDNTVTWTRKQPPVAARGGTSTRGMQPAGAPAAPAIRVWESTGRVRGNVVTRAKGTVVVDSSGGIVVGFANAQIKGNTVTRFPYGITVGYDTHGRVLDNVVSTGSKVGILLYDIAEDPVADPETDPTLTSRGNRVRGFQESGLEVSDSGGLLIDHNDLRGNPGVDCKDDSAVLVSAWHWNRGDDAQPAKLCKNPAKPGPGLP